MSLPRLFPSYSLRSALAGAAATSLGLALGPQLARAVARGGHPPRTGRHLKAVVLSVLLLVGLLGSAGAIQTSQATPSAPDGGDTASMYRGDTARTGVFPGHSRSRRRHRRRSGRSRSRRGRSDDRLGALADPGAVDRRLADPDLGVGVPKEQVIHLRDPHPARHTARGRMKP